jgi:hypothetical protein
MCFSLFSSKVTGFRESGGALPRARGERPCACSQSGARARLPARALHGGRRCDPACDSRTAMLRTVPVEARLSLSFFFVFCRWAALSALPTADAPHTSVGWRVLQQSSTAGGAATRVPCGGADLNSSGSVDVADLLLALGAFGRSASEQAVAPFDLSGNGSVDVADILIILGAYGQLCETAPVAGASDACGCINGEGWSSSASACVDGAHTSTSEANGCLLALSPPTAEQACGYLSNIGLDCGACLTELPDEPTTCPEWNAAQDRAVERTALFPDGVKRLYNETDWLVS